MLTNETEEFFPPPFTSHEAFLVYIKVRDGQTTAVPYICGIGFVTNLVSLIVFVQPNLRRSSCGVYLASKSVSDLVFLLTVLIVWLTRVDIKIFFTSGVCQTVIFCSYLSSFVSIWLAVVLTVENLLCVVKPWFVKRSCNAISALVLTASILIFGIGIYQFSIWNNGIGNFYEKPQETATSMKATEGNLSQVFDQHSLQSDKFSTINQTLFLNTEFDISNFTNTTNTTEELYQAICTHFEIYADIILTMTYIDTLITIVVPIVILAVTNAAIAIIACRTSRRTRARTRASTSTQGSTGAPLVKSRSSAAAMETKACKFLFMVSMTILIFHTPSHVIRLTTLFSFGWLEVVLQRLFETLLYLHYVINFFVYIIFGDNFRQVFISLCKGKIR
ncbi:C-C chemokine receptor type 5-like [Physella acuta]|uniref:C-C chemokine receptor type 5-like n=1 Tax=Physella acuta TaxID=109671 RepID=UPI0027DBC8BE|nr:C-C chemokine receptor type 5-like [Physella acuta]